MMFRNDKMRTGQEQAMAKRAAADQDKFIVRLPDGMRDRLRQEAELAGRSINSEVVHRLTMSFAVQDSNARAREAWIAEREARAAGAPEDVLDVPETIQNLQRALSEEMARAQERVFNRFGIPNGADDEFPWDEHLADHKRARRAPTVPPAQPVKTRKARKAP